MKRIFVFICALLVLGYAHGAEYTVLCPENYYVVDEHCEYCPSGTYSEGGDVTECTRQCPEGKYYNKGKCSVCPDGYPYSDPSGLCYSDKKMRLWDGSVQCKTIPDGCITAGSCDVCEVEPEPCEYVEYSDGTVKSGCTANPCLSDKSTTFRFPRTNWSTGYNEDAGVCEQCRPGYFLLSIHLGNGVYENMCLLCIAGTYSRDGNSFDSCDKCPAGTYSTIGATQCTLCPAGTYSGAGSAECASCPDGTASPVGATDIAQCVANVCDAGFYGDGETCIKCPDTYPNSDAGARYSTECYSDTKLREWTGGQTEALPTGCTDAIYDECQTDACEYVEYNMSVWETKSGCVTNDVNCVKPILSVTANPGYIANGTVCDVCPAGTYSAGGDVTECTPCPENTYSAVGAAECTPCPDEYPNSDTGATSVYDCYSNVKERPWTGHQVCTVPINCTVANCTPCEIKPCTYVLRKTSSHNTEVISGCATNNANCSTPMVSVSGASPGFHINGLSCEICPTGTYSPGGDATTCEPCPDGATTLMGASSRDECMRILNYLPPDSTIPNKIYLAMKKSTQPSLAVQVGDNVFYGNMTPLPDDKTLPGLNIKYDDTNYSVSSNLGPRVFYIITTPDTTEFSFSINVYGDYYISWGDGTSERFFYSEAEQNSALLHTYGAPGEYIIILSGRSTGCHSTCTGRGSRIVSDISFINNVNIAKIGGTLTNIFRISDEKTCSSNIPCFGNTFYGCSNLTGIISQAGMFGNESQYGAYSFTNCPNVTLVD